MFDTVALNLPVSVAATVSFAPEVTVESLTRARTL